MFNTLLESKRKKTRNLAGSVTSAVIHVLLVTAAVLTSRATALTKEDAAEDVNFVAPDKPKEPPPPDKNTPPPPETPNTPPPPKGFQTLTAPIDIPTVIPTIDLTARVTNELDFSGKGVQGGVAAGAVGGTGKVDSDQPFFSYEVEKMAQVSEQVTPAYPNILRQTKQTGRVVVQFVVDTSGRADMATFKIVESSNALFDPEVRKVLPKFKFKPAEIGSRKVPMYVQLPFDFKLDGGDNDD